MTDLHANVPVGSVQFNSQVSMLARVDAGNRHYGLVLSIKIFLADIIAEALSILGRVQPQIIRGAAAPTQGGG